MSGEEDVIEVTIDMVELKKMKVRLVYCGRGLSLALLYYMVTIPGSRIEAQGCRIGSTY